MVALHRASGPVEYLHVSRHGKLPEAMWMSAQIGVARPSSGWIAVLLQLNGRGLAFQCQGVQFLDPEWHDLAAGLDDHVVFVEGWVHPHPAMMGVGKVLEARMALDVDEASMKAEVV